MGCGGSKARQVGASNAKKPTLGYWGIIGRGDQCRILLQHLGVDFEDKYFGPGESANVADSQWPGCKANLGMVIPNMPYFQDGDVVHAETLPVLRTICRKYAPKYLGRNQKEQAYADSFTSTIYDNFQPWLAAAFFAPVTPQGKPALMDQAKAIVATVAKCLGSKKFIAGDVTYCDFMAYWALKYFDRFDESIVKSDAKVGAYVKRMHDLKGVAAAEANYDKSLALLPGNAAWMADHPFKG